jgi:glycosyltransferase involved in cell wall biosynthesis
VAPRLPRRIALVIPCYDEELRLPAQRFEAFLDAEPDFQLFFVDDGSTDATPARLAAIATRFPGRAHVRRMRENRGKAEAVRLGMREALEAGFDYAGYWDADLSAPLDEVHALLDRLDAHPELWAALGARVQLVGRSIERRAVRHYPGRVFATLASIVLGVAIYDTQCGAKLFRNVSAVRRAFDAAFLTGWSFDVELLARLATEPGAGAGHPLERVIIEVPLRRWHHVPSHHVRPADFARALIDLARIRWRYGSAAARRRASRTARVSPP